MVSVFGIPFFEPLGDQNIATNGSTLNNTSSLRFGSGNVVNQGRGISFGGQTSFQDSRSFVTETINEGDTITNIIGSQVEGFSISRKQSQEATPTISPTASFENPLTLSPNIAGSSTVGTGQSEVSSGLNLQALALVGGVTVLGLAYFGVIGKKGAKK